MVPAWVHPVTKDKQSTFRVDAVTTEQNFLDLGAPGTSLGDQIVFTTQLLKGESEVGHQDGFMPWRWWPAVSHRVRTSAQSGI